jgi:hypothetical protein
MLALPLLVTTLALAPTGESFRFSVSAGGSFAYSSYGAPAPGYYPREQNLGGNAGLGLTLYLRRIVDDETPPSLQPFLQRATELHVDGGGGGGQETWRDLSPHLSYTHGWFDASISGYARGYLYGYAHVGVQYNDASGALYAMGPIGDLAPLASTTLSVPVDVAAGLRHGDLRLSVGWGVTPTQVTSNGATSGFSVPFWGGLHADAAGVVKKRLWLSAGVGILDNGAYAEGNAELYLARRFGFSAGVHGGHDRDARGNGSDYAGFGVGFVAWATTHVSANVRYAFQWNDLNFANSSPNAPQYVHLVSLGATYRR